MPDVSPCPAAAEWAEFLLGRTPDPEAGRLEDHLAGCAACLRVAGTVPGEDALVAAVRKAPQVLAGPPRAAGPDPG